MSWSRSEFLSVMDTDIAVAIFSDKQVNEFTNQWSADNKAALLHANGVTAESALEDKLPLMQLVAAFGCKDVVKLNELVNYSRVTVGARLDYLLPLFDVNYGAGEDIFVASTKVMLGGNLDADVKLKSGNMHHMIGPAISRPYSQNELSEIEGYVNSSFVIRNILLNAPNKSLVEPTQQAVEYMLNNAATYRDSNNNPVIVFIPGAVSIPGYTTSELITRTLGCGANIDAIGFFGVSGIVWSIILGDVEAVETFIEHGAALDLEDEMGNKNVATWAAATCTAVSSMSRDDRYRDRTLTIFSLVEDTLKKSDMLCLNHLGNMPREYFDLSTYLELCAAQNRVSVARTFGLFANGSESSVVNLDTKTYGKKLGI